MASPRRETSRRRVDLLPGDEGRTLCDIETVVPRQRLGKREGCWPTCPDCDTTWRLAEGIPVRNAR